MDGAERVTNALIAQWVAEDLHPARTQEEEEEEEVAVENKEEEECEVDEEVSTIASDCSGK